ncbi:MAG TPA: arginine decarboxylase, pyruvoyl-dependent [Candidatus Omnitrophota bacterium]|mgnify:CR=1 FL=1|nr:arginine decarboxylase, pyruvoyl-dependent [Candidatus Omnitrophota bacterium]HPS20134.1 arginine decarboxylase, pyruvoyl-dependent [Candidatus Omnitrophota bacterium]
MQIFQAHAGKEVFVPKKVFFTKGVGTHKAELRSFELALRDAGIEKCNLVTVSSILPPACQVISKNEGVKELFPGMVTFTVLSRCASNEAHRLIAASVGCAVPADPNAYGYLSEHHGYGQNEKFAGDYAEDLAAAMLASTLGLEFDEQKSWDENKEIYRLSDKIVRSTNITQTAVIGSEGNFTTVLSAAVFLF